MSTDFWNKLEIIKNIISNDETMRLYSFYANDAQSEFVINWEEQNNDGMWRQVRIAEKSLGKLISSAYRQIGVDRINAEIDRKLSSK